MTEMKPVPSDAETGKTKSPSKSLLLVFLVLLVVLSFGLEAYSNWLKDNETITGIGISFEEVVERSTLVVTQAHKNTPAFMSGLQTGDKIVEINGKEIVVAADFQKVIKDLPPGTKVNLTVQRDGKKMMLVTEVAVLKRKDFK